MGRMSATTSWIEGPNIYEFWEANYAASQMPIPVGEGTQEYYESIWKANQKAGTWPPVGAAVATFAKGSYPQAGHRHAALFGGYYQVNGKPGIVLYEQYKGSPPSFRALSWDKGGDISNDPSAGFIDRPTPMKCRLSKHEQRVGILKPTESG
jgi:hypothetical protein